MSDGLIADLQAIVGEGHVAIAGQEMFDRLASRFAVHPGVDLDHVAAIRPASAEEVRQVVGYAHEAGLALLSVFGPSNVGARVYGSGRSLILDLGRMNRIHEIDVANGFVRVEPGVTYAQLADHFAAERLPLWVDSERDPQASVVGSTVGKGTGFTPYGDHALVQCGAEYALPYGELMRSGMGAMPGSKTWQLYKYALGPYADGLALQSGLMVPTQMGVWVMGAVPAQDMLALDIVSDAALAFLIETLRDLKIANMLPGTVSITSAALDSARFPQDGEHPAWRLVTPLYGIPRVLELTRAAILAAVERVSGVSVTSSQGRATASVRERINLMSGRAGTAGVSFAGQPDASTASISFVAPIEDRFASHMISSARSAMREHDLSATCEFAIVGRALMFQLHLPYSTGNPHSVRAMADAATRLADRMQTEGIGVAATSFELAHLDVGNAAETGLSILHERIAVALTA